MFLIARFNRIENPTFFQKIKFKIKPTRITVTNFSEYDIADIEFIGDIDYVEISKKLREINPNILADEDIGKEIAEKYGFFIPKEFFLKVAVNTVCSLVLSSKTNVNRRKIAFYDRQAEHMELSKQLVEHFFGVSIITDRVDAYEAFAKKMLNEFGAVLIIKRAENKNDSLVIYSDKDNCGSFRVSQKIFECFDSKNAMVNAPEKVNKISFAAAISQFSNSNEYNNLCADILKEKNSPKKVSAQSILKYINKRI